MPSAKPRREHIRGSIWDREHIHTWRMRRADAWFLLALVGPSRPAAPDVWAVNKRDYEILLDWFRTPTDEQLQALEQGSQPAP